MILALDHVQLAMPENGEDRARGYYVGLLEFSEVPKPENLTARGGCWFESGCVRLHLGVDSNFLPARKAHPAFLVRDLPVLLSSLANAGFETVVDQPLSGFDRAYVSDPFGNRIELMQRRV